MARETARASREGQRSEMLFLSLASLLVLAGCVSRSPQKSSETLPGGGTYELKLKGAVGQETLTKFYSHSETNVYEEDQLIKQRDEIVEFKVLEQVHKVENQSAKIHTKVSTVSKDGMVDLHDLAFPEKDEDIEFIYASHGRVLRAGGYPEQSVFYIPTLPLPNKPVQVGDTWTMDHHWVGLKNGVPLGVHLAAIFKQVVNCGKSEQCAELEISGEVGVVGAEQSRADFSSQIWGRVLFAIGRGAVVWSDLRSYELMLSPGNRMQVTSCMVSLVDSPKDLRLKTLTKPSCKPGRAAVAAAPN